MEIGKRPWVLAFVALGLCAGTVPMAGYWSSRSLPASASRYTPKDAQRLRPGQYRWAPYASDASPIKIAVDLTNQRAFVFQGDALVGISAVSTGRRGHGTPTGSFPILEKARFHRSNLYSAAPMPFMQRLTWGGVALHAGYNPGRPASHGCIRLPYGFAKALFRATSVGGMVVVTRGARIAPDALPRTEMAAAPATPMPAAAPPMPVVTTVAARTMEAAPPPPAPAAPPAVAAAPMISTERSVAVMVGTSI